MTICRIQNHHVMAHQLKMCDQDDHCLLRNFQFDRSHTYMDFEVILYYR